MFTLMSEKAHDQQNKARLEERLVNAEKWQHFYAAMANEKMANFWAGKVVTLTMRLANLE